MFRFVRHWRAPRHRSALRSLPKRGASKRSTVRTQEQDKGRSARRYAKIAATANGGRGHPESVAYATSLGYSEEDLKTVPADAVMSLGCGTPAIRARLHMGEIVLDLGSGGGLDAALRDEVWGEWLAVALSKPDYLRAIEQAGFQEVTVEEEVAFNMAENDERLKGRIVSIGLTARKK
jgi:hypothetical protein